jgi:hypothetical protein
MWWRLAKANVCRWLDQELKYEPDDRENEVIGLALFIFVILWTAAGPPARP